MKRVLFNTKPKSFLWLIEMASFIIWFKNILWTGFKANVLVIYLELELVLKSLIEKVFIASWFYSSVIYIYSRCHQNVIVGRFSSVFSAQITIIQWACVFGSFESVFVYLCLSCWTEKWYFYSWLSLEVFIELS